MKEINLIVKKKKPFSHTKTILIFRVISALLLFLTFSSSIIIFFLKLNSPLSLLMKEEKDLLSSLALYKQKIIKLIVVKERLNSVNEILSKRGDLEEKINTLIKLRNQSGSVQIISLAVDMKNISLTISSSSLLSMNLFLDKVVEMSDNKTMFKKVILSGITVDRISGKYTLSINADLL